jgi:DNA-binding XRE family transcriptional regulator
MTDARHIGRVIRDAREQLKLSEEFCAKTCGLSVASYGDVELHEDEFFDNISLGTARRICQLLGLDLLDLASQHLKADVVERSPADDARFYSRHGLISNTRLKKCMSEENLADAIGFETITIQLLERTSDYIECLPTKVVVDAANALDLDPGKLICNRPVDPKPAG